MAGAGITLILTHRKEGDWLPWTVANAEKQLDKRRIICIEDEPAVGVSFRRHEGIVQARTKYVVVADAHMDFQDGLFEATIDHLQKHPQDVLCVKCNGIESKTRKTIESDRYGCRFYEAVWTPRTIPLGSRWYNTPQKEIGLVMGAFYAFERDWYLDQLGGVWQHHRGWGKSEQMISAMNWLCGGRNYCRSDLWASHLFRKSRRHDQYWVINQRQRNAALIAWSMADEQGLETIRKAIYGPGVRKKFIWDEAVLGDPATEQIREHLESHSVRSWGDFRREILSVDALE